jgi:hypothetical protein
VPVRSDGNSFKNKSDRCVLPLPWSHEQTVHLLQSVLSCRIWHVACREKRTQAGGKWQRWGTRGSLTNVRGGGDCDVTRGWGLRACWLGGFFFFFFFMFLDFWSRPRSPSPSNGHLLGVLATLKSLFCCSSPPVLNKINYLFTFFPDYPSRGFFFFFFVIFLDQVKYVIWYRNDLLGYLSLADGQRLTHIGMVYLVSFHI